MMTILGLLSIILGVGIIINYNQPENIAVAGSDYTYYDHTKHLVEQPEWKKYSKKSSEFTSSVIKLCEIQRTKSRTEYLKQLNIVEKIQKELDSLEQLIPYENYDDNGNPI